MGALSDYICKSNEAVDKMVEIYIHIHIRIFAYNLYTYTIPVHVYKIMDGGKDPRARDREIPGEEGNLDTIYLIRKVPKR